MLCSDHDDNSASSVFPSTGTPLASLYGMPNLRHSSFGDSRKILPKARGAREESILINLLNSNACQIGIIT